MPKINEDKWIEKRVILRKIVVERLKGKREKKCWRKCNNKLRINKNKKS